MRRVPIAVASAAAVLVTGGAWAVLRDDAKPEGHCRVRVVAGRFAPFRPANDVGFLSDGIWDDRHYEGMAWFEVDSPGQMRRDGESLRLDGARRLGGRLPTPDALWTSEPVATHASRELKDGASVVFAVGPVSPLPGHGGVRFAASLRRDGSATLLGGCARFHSAKLREFVAHRNATGDRRSPAEIVRAFATDPVLVGELVDWERYGERRAPWYGVAPARRMLRENDAPAAVMAGLAHTKLSFRFPSAWRRYDARFAVFVPGLGWHPETAPFSLDAMALDVWTPPDRPLEVWVVPGAGEIARRYARVAVLQPDQLVDADVVELRARAAAYSLTELVARARAGEAIFRTGP